MNASHPGIEPGTFGLEVQRAILCANGTGCENVGHHSLYILYWDPAFHLLLECTIIET